MCTRSQVLRLPTQGLTELFGVDLLSRYPIFSKLDIKSTRIPRRITCAKNMAPLKFKQSITSNQQQIVGIHSALLSNLSVLKGD
jgi:hypothetical protein